MLAKRSIPLPIPSINLATPFNPFSRSKNLLKRIPPAKKRKKLPIELKISWKGLAILNEGKEDLVVSFFSIFSSLAFLFCSCCCLFFILKENRSRL